MGPVAAQHGNGTHGRMRGLAPKASIISYKSSEEGNAFINEHWDANPLGVEFDPEEWLSRLRAGVHKSRFVLRQTHEPVSPLRGEISNLLSAD